VGVVLAALAATVQRLAGVVVVSPWQSLMLCLDKCCQQSPSVLVELLYLLGARLTVILGELQVSGLWFLALAVQAVSPGVLVGQVEQQLYPPEVSLRLGHVVAICLQHHPLQRQVAEGWGISQSGVMAEILQLVRRLTLLVGVGWAGLAAAS
jgi:hypothetical protein